MSNYLNNERVKAARDAFRKVVAFALDHGHTLKNHREFSNLIHDAEDAFTAVAESVAAVSGPARTPALNEEIEAWLGLHRHVEIHYVVDGYEVEFFDGDGDIHVRSVKIDTLPDVSSALAALPAARPQGTATWIDEQVNFVAQALKAFAHPHPNHPAGTWRPYADAARKLLAGIADRASPPSPGVSREQVRAAMLEVMSEGSTQGYYTNFIDMKLDALFSPAPASGDTK